MNLHHVIMFEVLVLHNSNVISPFYLGNYGET